MNVSGQTAIVTGGASGLGEATAQALAAAGACAGIAPSAKPIGRDGKASPLGIVTRAIGVNLIGTINSCRLATADMAALEPMNDNERGCIVTTASVAAFEGQSGQLDYAASKGGVAAMTVPLARELASEGIRVNCIAPGLMDTPMMGGLSGPAKQFLLETTVYPKRLGGADEYAALVVHIAENTFMNGSVIRFYCQEVHMPLPLNVSGHNLRTSRRPRGLRTMAALEWIWRPSFLHVLANFRRLADDRRRAVVALAIHRITAWL